MRDLYQIRLSYWDMRNAEYEYKSNKPCPIAQIIPPNINALINDGHALVFGTLDST